MAFPQAVGFLRGFIDFSLEVDLPLWGDRGKSILMHSVGEIAMGSIAKAHNNLILLSPADSGSRRHSLRLFGADEAGVSGYLVCLAYLDCLVC